MPEGRVHGIAEVEAIHRDVDGTILSHERAIGPVTYIIGKDGQPTDVRKEES